MFKRFLVAGVIIVALGMVLAGCKGGPVGFPMFGPMVGPMCGPGGPEGHGGPGGPPPDMQCKDGKSPGDAISAQLDKIAAELKLTEAQKVKFEELKSKLKARMEHPKECKGRDFKECKDNEHFDFMAEMKKDNPDVNMMADKCKEDMDRMSAKMKERIDRETKDGKENIDLFTGFYNILDENQKKILIDKVHKKINAMEVLKEDF
ncbi:MAG: Spy/CpxP family protein refolding chaperone [Candidatus Eremiobacterota bacterium]